MKTGRDVLERAMRLLNYTNEKGMLDGNLYAELNKRGLTVVNQIYADLWFMESNRPFEELTHIEQMIHLPQRRLHDCMPYGVAMLLAQTEGDGDNQMLFASLYNQKRAAQQTTIKRSDVMPDVEIGGWCD